MSLYVGVLRVCTGIFLSLANLVSIEMEFPEKIM